MSGGYPYNAIAEHPIVPEFDDTLKWKWNGALLDLSELPFDEYGKTIYNVTGTVTGSTTGDTSSTLTSNSAMLSYDNTGDKYAIEATLQYPSQSEVTITVKVDGMETPVTITIPAGEISAKAATTIPTSSAKPGLSEPTVSPAKDGTYKYSVVLPEIDTGKFKAYYGVWPQRLFNELTPEEIAGMDSEMADSTGVVLNYVIGGIDIRITTEEELEAFANVLVLAIPQSIYNEEKYKITEKTFGDDADFAKKADAIILNSQYTILYLSGEMVGDIAAFAPKYMEDKTLSFDLKYEE